MDRPSTTTVAYDEGSRLTRARLDTTHKNVYTMTQHSNPVCRTHRIVAVCVALLICGITHEASGQFWRPEARLALEDLEGWRQLGEADWRAQGGELVGRAGGSGGWLVFDRSFQDQGLHTAFRCTGTCGLLFRAEQTPEGMRGIYVSLAEDDLAAYLVTLDPEGRIQDRERISPEERNVWRQSEGVEPPPGVDVPSLVPPAGDYLPGDWNTVDVMVYGSSHSGMSGFERSEGHRIVTGLNGAGERTSELLGGVLPDEGGPEYGPFALHVAEGEVRFRNMAYADFNVRHAFPREKVSPNFEVIRLTEFVTANAASVGDFNGDGFMDVAAGSMYWMGPEFSIAREIYPFESYNPTKTYPVPSMFNLAHDFTGDGLTDYVSMAGTAGAGVGTLYVNPGEESRRWDGYEVLPSVGNEVTVMHDVDGDGEPEIVHAYQARYLAYSEPNPENPTQTWKTTIISEAGPWGANQRHGLGAGDISGDGRADIVTVYGWWEQPDPESGEELWTYHPQPFGRQPAMAGVLGGAEMGVFDVNGDGLADVVTALEAHGFGLSWFEQQRDADGRISFVEHTIMDGFGDDNAGGVTFTQLHGAAFGDMDGDGVMDVITGKSFQHHFGYADPDAWGPPVLYWYRTVRNPAAPGGAEFVPELIHNRSGVGSKVEVADVDGNGAPDVVISAHNGTFIHLNHTPQKRSAQPVR